MSEKQQETLLVNLRKKLKDNITDIENRLRKTEYNVMNY